MNDELLERPPAIQTPDAAGEAPQAGARDYRQLFDHVHEGVAYCQMLYDDQGRPVDFVCLDANPAFERLTGLRNVVGRRVTESVPGIRESSPEVFEICGRAAMTGEEGQFEYELVSKPQVWMKISVYCPAKGYFVALFEDITRAKQREADREAMLTLLRLTGACNSTRELIRTVTAELQVWSGCEAVGVRLREGDDFPYFETRGFPQTFVEAERYLCVRDANGELLRDIQSRPVLACMCGNILRGRTDPRQPFFTPGGSFWTNRSSELLASTTEAERQSCTRNRCNAAGFESVALIPLRFSGETLGLLQCNDRRADRFTTDKIAVLERAAASLAIALVQRRTQEALRNSEERYRLISENTKDVIWLVDIASRRVTYISPSVRRHLGYAPEEVMAMDIGDVLAPASREAADKRMVEVMAALAAGDESVRTETHEVEQVRKDGSIVQTEVVVTVLPDQTLLGVTRDITERKRAQEQRENLQAQLFQAQKMESIGRLAGGVAHDFNNLLTVINGYSLMALQALHASDPLQDSLNEILVAGNRAAALTQQLLAFSRKQVMQPRVLDLNYVIQEMTPMLARIVGEDVEVTLRPCDTAAVICADPNQLEQVIMNLVVNSRDAMPRGGKLWIETAIVDWTVSTNPPDREPLTRRYVKLSVIDSGAGMDEVTRRQVFEPFFTTKGVGKGTGLGLPMVQGIVEQSGGFIQVESQVGHGTTFDVFLPSVTSEVEHATPSARNRSPRGTETILVVEDQADVRKYVAGYLRALGYQVIQAATAGEALLCCERDSVHIDLVLTDVVMPVVSGKELAERLLARWPKIKVLFMSGYSDDAIAQHGILDKDTKLIQKPFSTDQLAFKVREILTAS